MADGPSNANNPSKVPETDSRPLTTEEVEKAFLECGKKLRDFIRETKPLTEEENRLVRKTVLAYILRGLTIDRQNAEINGAGTAKASWIAKTMRLSARSVKSARKELIAVGFITKDTNSFQRKLNRDGAYFVLNLSWPDKPKVRQSDGEASPTISPLRVKTHPIFAPPYKDKKTSYESKNQKTQNRVLNQSGICKVNQEEEPKLSDIKQFDLTRFSRLKALFAQALKAGWVINSEAEFLNWVAAAVRAQTVEARCPVRVFLGIVKARRWHFITSAQEERARAAIIRNRTHEEVFHAKSQSIERVGVILSKLNL